MTTSVRRQAFVDLSVLVSNLRILADLPASTIVDVRADAYGHGLVPVARALAAAGAGGFLVSRPDEADSLAEAALPATIIVGSARPDAVDSSPAVLGPELFGLDPDVAVPSAFRLVGEAISVKNVARGRGVSYGYTYRTSRPTTLALVALGYADGIPRVASNRAPVRVGDFTGRVTGRIAMDQFVVDLEDSTASIGDDVVLFGDPSQDEPTIHQWANATGLAAEVVVSRIGTRVERVYSS